MPAKTPGQPVVAGKALGKGQVGGAEAQLNWVLERGGRLKEEAAQILAQLE